MISAETKSVIERGKEIYRRGLQSHLEAEHRDRFVAIEPDSGEFFLGDTFDAAVEAAREKFPTRITYTVRICHEAAMQIGVLRQ